MKKVYGHDEQMFLLWYGSYRHIHVAAFIIEIESQQVGARRASTVGLWLKDMGIIEECTRNIS